MPTAAGLPYDPFRGTVLPRPSTAAAAAGSSDPATPERLTEPERTEAPAPVVVPDSGAEPDTTTEQQPEQTETFDVADHTIPDVMRAVLAGTITAEQAHADEQARGDDARPRLLAKLKAALSDDPDL